MDLEVADPLLHTTDSKDAITKRKLDFDGGLPYYPEDGLKIPDRNLLGEAPPPEQPKGWFKRFLPSFINIFTFLLAAPGILQAAYARGGEDAFMDSNVLVLWAILCYGVGSVLGVGLRFLEGRLLSTYFPKSCGGRRFSTEDLQDVGAAGFWSKWILVLGTCVYVEVTASTVGRLYGLNEMLGQLFPGVRSASLSWLNLEPSTLIVLVLISFMVLPMWHKTKFDVTWFGLGPLFIANSFPWGFPMYRVIVGILSNYFKLVETHKEYTLLKAAAQKHLAP